MFHRGNKRVNKLVILLAANTLVAPTEIERIIQKSTIVCAGIKQYRQRRTGMNSGAECVER